MQEFTKEWGITLFIGIPGLFFLIITYGALFVSWKNKKNISGVPFFGGLLIFIAFLLSPYKWLCFLGFLDYGFWQLPCLFIKDFMAKNKTEVLNTNFEILTDRLILRPWNESDAENLYKYAKDPAIGPIAGWPIHTSIDNSKEIIKTVLSGKEIYAVCLKTDNKPIGSIGLFPPDFMDKKAPENEFEIGYWIGVPFWGNGYIPEAIIAVLNHAFADLNATAIWCGYYDGNKKSKRCQEKCGFIYHHTEKDKPCPLMNDIRTEHFTRITKEEWKINAIK